MHSLGLCCQYFAGVTMTSHAWRMRLGSAGQICCMGWQRRNLAPGRDVLCCLPPLIVWRGVPFGRPHRRLGGEGLRRDIGMPFGAKKVCASPLD